MRKLKKGLASLLAVVMLLSVLPVAAMAAEADENTAAEVVFNLGTMEVTVGTDEEKLETAEVPYDLFDGDGSLHLERAGLVAYNHGVYQRSADVLGFFGYSVARPEVLERRMKAYEVKG